MGQVRILRKAEARAKVDRELWHLDPESVEDMLHLDLVRFCSDHGHLMVGQMRLEAFDPQTDALFPDLIPAHERDLVTVIAQCITAVLADVDDE